MNINYNVYNANNSCIKARILKINHNLKLESLERYTASNCVT